MKGTCAGNFFAIIWLIVLAVTVDPVKHTPEIFGSLHSGRPTSAPIPVTIWRLFLGTPA